MTAAARTGRDLVTLSAESLWYGDDLAAGDWIDLGSVRVSREEIIDFATRFDPLPIHVDGANSLFGDVIASGIHTMALYSKLASHALFARLALIAGKGIDRLRLPHPVLPGAVLTGSADIVDIALQQRRAEVRYLSTLVDHDDKVVLSFTGITVLARRDRQPGPPSEGDPAQ